MARILVADDSAALLSALGLSLRDAGHEVTSTNSGADALCLLGSKPPPDLLVLDVLMPGLDGYAVLRGLGPTAPPVVLISGGAIDETAFDPGKVTRVLTKPFDQTQLLATVTEALARTKEAAPNQPEEQSHVPI